MIKRIRMLTAWQIGKTDRLSATVGTGIASNSVIFDHRFSQDGKRE
jgi:hypothetical protein